jgi:putative ABC transport system permease protein
LQQEGSKKDITIWMNLHDAQAILGKENRITEIAAVETRKALARPQKVRNEIAGILGNVDVIERRPQSLAVLQARLGAAREHLATIDRETESQEAMMRQHNFLALAIGLAVLILCCGWVAVISHSNVTDRETEIAILRTMGATQSQVLRLFLTKWILLSVFCGTGGYFAGTVIGPAAVTGNSIDFSVAAEVDPYLIASSIGAVVVLAACAGYVPARQISRRDPADTLR